MGNSLRTGLCINETTNTEDIKIIKRGLPKIYEYTEKKDSPNIKFQNKLFKFISNLFQNNSISSLSLIQIKILSEISVHISYESQLSHWVISTNKKPCVIFKDKNDLNELSQAGKIDNLLYDICSNWLDTIIEFEENSNLLYLEFLEECSNKTLIGFYCGYEQSLLKYEEKKIVFYSFVYNMQKLSQFSASILEIDFFYQKYGLYYQKAELKAKNLRNIENLKDEIHNLYVSISSDYTSKQQKGSIFLVLSNNKIMTTFKIYNNELQLLSLLKSSIEEDEKTVISQSFNKEKYTTMVSSFQLPKEKEFYLNLIPGFSGKLLESNTQIISTQFLQNYLKETSLSGLSPVINTIIWKKRTGKNENSYLSLNQNKIGTTPSLTKYSTSVIGKGYNEGVLLNNNKCITELSLHKQSTRDPSGKQGLLENKKISGINGGISENFIYDTTPKSEIKTPSSNKKLGVRFVDIEYKLPLTDEVLVESYKKYYVGNTYEENMYFDENDRKKTTCCLVF